MVWVKQERFQGPFANLECYLMGWFGAGMGIDYIDNQRGKLR